jgi:predicted DNA-binding ribbon-helix-helix protein
MIDLFKSQYHNRSVKAATVRTSIDIPRDLHRKIHEAAARKGCSARKLILNGIERVVEETSTAQPRRRLRLERGLIRPAGRRIDLTNDQIYDLIEFP